MAIVLDGTSGITTPGVTNSASETVAGTGKFATTIGVGNATPSASGSGITFPATQSASSDANTLDDYEEGTWTPVISSAGGAMTYTLGNTVARYTKIGNRVFFTASMQFSSRSGGSGTFYISLPFQASSTANFWQGSFTMGYSGNAFTVNYEGVSYTDPNQTNMFVRKNVDQVSLIDATEVNSSGHLIFGGQYMVD